MGSWFFLWPFVINNVCSIISGAFAYSNLYVAEVFARLLYGFWFLHDASLSGAVLFAGWRLVRILNSHLARFGKDNARYQAIKTGIFKIKMLVGIIIVCLMSFASFLLLYGILRDRIMTSTVGSVILAVIWTYLGPMTTVFVEAAIIIKYVFNNETKKHKAHIADVLITVPSLRRIQHLLQIHQVEQVVILLSLLLQAKQVPATRHQA